jgi:CubicO group peptidase (beta-lactamase class C family)
LKKLADFNKNMRQKQNVIKKVYLLLVILASIPCATLAQTLAAANPKETDNAAEKIDEYLSRSAALGFSGAILIAQNGKIVLNKGYGYADRKRRIPFTPSTVYNLESTTKQFVAAGILKLEEQGKLKTTDLLTKYFDNVPEDKKEITLHHLLTHTAGLNGMSGDDFEVIERNAAVRRILDSKLRWAPGTKWAYSNPGYTLLAVVIEKVSGEPHEKFLREQLWIPAGMIDTGYMIPEQKRATRAFLQFVCGYGNAA